MFLPVRFLGAELCWRVGGLVGCMDGWGKSVLCVVGFVGMGAV